MSADAPARADGSTRADVPARADAVRVARNLRLLGRMALRHAEDDPFRLAVQTMRRLPRRLRRPVAAMVDGLGGVAGRRSLRALGAYLADHTEAARGELQSPSDVAGGGRLTAELAVQLGLEAPAGAPAAVQARAAWRRGDLSGAVAILEHARSSSGRRQAARLASELATMRPGYRVALPARAAAAPAAARPAVVPGEHRVLHVLTNSLPRTQSGYALRSHAILRAQQAAGMAVEGVTRIGYPVNVGLPLAAEVDVVDGVSYRRLLPDVLASTPEGRLSQTVEALLPVVARFGPSVLHTTTHFPNALVTQAVGGAAGLPWVYEMRGQLEKTWLASRPEAERAEAARSERFLLAGAKETEMALAADHVVVLSEVLKADLVTRGVHEDRITVVPNGVDARLLAQQVAPHDARRRVGLAEEGFWVGSVSSLVDYEGLDVLLRAVAVLRARGVDARCAIAGDGVARPQLLRLAAELGIGDVVVMPGRVPRAEAVTWHRALDVFVVPRRDLEVCRTVTPLKPIEAMAVGRPLVVSDLPALAEIALAPGSGLASPAGDHLALADRLHGLRDDAALRQRLAERGREFAATRTWHAMAERYRTIYDTLGSNT